MEFYNNPEKVDTYEKMCEEYNGSELYAVIKKHLDKGASLLELGCGPGKDIQNLKDYYNIIASDLSDEFISRINKRFPYIRCLKLDAVSIKTDEKFDCIYSNKVLHHLKVDELIKSFKRQQKLIKSDGLFAHSFWIGEEDFEMEGMYFKYHNKDELLGIIGETFRIKETFSYTEMEELDSIFVIAENNL